MVLSGSSDFTCRSHSSEGTNCGALLTTQRHVSEQIQARALDAALLGLRSYLVLDVARESSAESAAASDAVSDSTVAASGGQLGADGSAAEATFASTVELAPSPDPLVSWLGVGSAAASAGLERWSAVSSVGGASSGASLVAITAVGAAMPDTRALSCAALIAVEDAKHGEVDMIKHTVSARRQHTMETRGARPRAE